MSYHRVHEAVAAGIINVVHLSGDENPADILTKVLSHAKAYRLIHEFLFWNNDKAYSDQDEGSVKKAND